MLDYKMQIFVLNSFSCARSSLTRSVAHHLFIRSLAFVTACFNKKKFDHLHNSAIKLEFFAKSSDFISRI